MAFINVFLNIFPESDLKFKTFSEIWKKLIIFLSFFFFFSDLILNDFLWVSTISHFECAQWAWRGQNQVPVSQETTTCDEPSITGCDIICWWWEVPGFALLVCSAFSLLSKMSLFQLNSSCVIIFLIFPYSPLGEVSEQQSGAELPAGLTIAGSVQW